ncbi:unnamed protein product [Closterium sp. Yama58-4]|nr:unnamed protein product [Closterium sp. Yama58-4]
MHQSSDKPPELSSAELSASQTLAFCSHHHPMAPGNDASSSSAPAAAAVNGKKSLESRQEPVTPKMLFNGVTDGPFGVEDINKLAARTSALKLDDLPNIGKGKINDQAPVAGSSSTASGPVDNGKKAVVDAEEDAGYLSDDPDECQDPVALNEIASQAGFAITLLILFACHKEVPRTIDTVKNLLDVWKDHLSENAHVTTKCHQLPSTYLSKTHFGRLQVVFQYAADANFVWCRKVDHMTMNDKKLTLGWQHPENAAYLKECAAHPEAIEVLLKGVRAVIFPEMIQKSLVSALLLKRGRTAFLDGSTFHRSQPTQMNVVVVGDLNMVADPDLDKSSGAGSGRENQRFLDLWPQHGLRDAFRAIHPTDREYTFRDRATKARSRIDRALVSSAMLGSLVEAEHAEVPRTLTDHWFAIRICLQIVSEQETGPGLWRFRATQKDKKRDYGRTSGWQGGRDSTAPHNGGGTAKEQLLKKEEQLEAYREDERERLQVPSPFLSAKMKMRKERMAIQEVTFKGKRYVGAQGVLEAASQHFAEAFGEAQGQAPLAADNVVVDMRFPDEVADRLGAAWTESEVKATLSGLPKGKSPGQDGLPAELFVSHWDLVVGSFMDFVRSFELTEEIPEAFASGHGSASQERRQGSAVELQAHHSPQHGEQHGFIPGRSLADAVTVVADAIEAADNGGEDWYLLLVDFQIAYDTVSRPFLFETISKLGIPANFVRWTKGLHQGSGTRLAINGWIGDRVEMRRGFRQGCPLAPYLFLCALEPLCAEIKKQSLGVKAEGGEEVAYVGYADDTSLILHGADQLRSATEALEHLLTAERVTMINNYVMPIFLFQAQIYPPWAKIQKTCDNYVSKGEATADKIFVLWSGELARLPKKEGGLGLVDPKDRLDSLAIRAVGKLLTERNITKRWLAEKTAAMPQGTATLFAHKSASKHWDRGSQRWKAIVDVFWGSPFADLPELTNGWEAERELLCFNRRIMFRGDSTSGNRKGTEGI